MKHKHIYKTANNHYTIAKSIKGKLVYFKNCKTLAEALTYRDRLIANNWKPLPPTQEELREKAIFEYYKRLTRHNRHRYYGIVNKYGDYIGMTKTIEEALYFRDLYSELPKKDVPNLKTVDLKTDNPYLEGLKYPIPKRLILEKPEPTNYGNGSIVQKGPTSFQIRHGKNQGNGGASQQYICSCPTYEMADYIVKKMNECEWDMTELQSIIDDYPKYYTELLYFYPYIIKGEPSVNGEDRWYVAPPKEYTDGKLDHILYYRLEDALYERDFLKEHNWDYDLLVEAIDDLSNPYYNMDLPPYPSRKIKNISERNYHEEELTLIHNAIQEDDSLSLEAAARIIEYTPPAIRRWLKLYYNSSWPEFKKISVSGDNPVDVLEKQEIIYQPDLSTAKPSNYNNYVSRKEDKYGVRYIVARKGVYYGAFEDEKLAHKISKEMAKVDWDKSKLEAIREKYNCKSKVMSKRWVYPNGKSWSVRRKNKDRRMVTYGTWKDKRIANIVRDMLVEYGFNLDNMSWVEDVAKWAVQMIDLYPSTMFGKTCIEDIIYLEDDCKIPYASAKGNSGKLTIQRTINGKNIYYGAYTEEKAREVVEFLEDNDWDKDLLKVMQEMGEI